jgi:hypothetical protein
MDIMCAICTAWGDHERSVASVLFGPMDDVTYVETGQPLAFKCQSSRSTSILNEP